MKMPHRFAKTRAYRVILHAMATTILVSRASGGVFVDDFSGGLNGNYWLIETSPPLYSVSTTEGSVTFTKPWASDHTFQYAKLTSRMVASGAFDVQVDFRNALLTLAGSGGANQVELVCYMGGRTFFCIRSDEPSSGPSVHAWVYASGPVGGTFGWQSWEATSGTLRITHNLTGRLSFWLDSTLIYESANGFAFSPATFAVFLVNNGTHDATSVTFDNFVLSADEISYPPLQLSAQRPSADSILLSWPAYPPGYVLETTCDLTVPTLWQAVTNGLVITNGQCFLTNTALKPAAFYRLRQGT
jgi:hypothetical protein